MTIKTNLMTTMTIRPTPPSSGIGSSGEERSSEEERRFPRFAFLSRLSYSDNDYHDYHTVIIMMLMVMMMLMIKRRSSDEERRLPRRRSLGGGETRSFSASF